MEQTLDVPTDSKVGQTATADSLTSATGGKPASLAR
jgi:hypothetical protein